MLMVSVPESDDLVFQNLMIRFLKSNDKVSEI